MTPSHVLRAAADRIERDGWCQGAYERDGACCANGAIIREAARLRTDPLPTLQTFGAYILARHPYRSVLGWNDETGRTVDEVLAALRGAAQEADHGR